MIKHEEAAFERLEAMKNRRNPWMIVLSFVLIIVIIAVATGATSLPR